MPCETVAFFGTAPKKRKGNPHTFEGFSDPPPNPSTKAHNKVRAWPFAGYFGLKRTNRGSQQRPVLSLVVNRARTGDVLKVGRSTTQPKTCLGLSCTLPCGYPCWAQRRFLLPHSCIGRVLTRESHLEEAGDAGSKSKPKSKTKTLRHNNPPPLTPPGCPMAGTGCRLLPYWTHFGLKLAIFLGKHAKYGKSLSSAGR